MNTATIRLKAYRGWPEYQREQTRPDNLERKRGKTGKCKGQRRCPQKSRVTVGRRRFHALPALWRSIRKGRGRRDAARARDNGRRK